MTIRQQDLDKLVDGELSPNELQTLVQKFDNEPNGWRLCGLAFLEAQAFGQTIPLIHQSPSPPVAELPDVSLKDRRTDGVTSSLSHWTLLATAVSFMLIGCSIAFALQAWNQVPASPSFNNLANRPTEGNETPLPPQGSHQSPSLPTVNTPNDELPEFVYLTQWNGANVASIPIPVDRSRPFDPNQNWDADWGISQEEIANIRAYGHEVATLNHLIPVSLESGKQLVVPMQEVYYYPTSNNLPVH